jgi:hypothetical protein
MAFQERPSSVEYVSRLYVSYLRSRSHLTAYIICCYYGLDGPDFDSRQKQPIFLFSKTVQTGSEDQPASRSVVAGFFPGE